MKLIIDDAHVDKIKELYEYYPVSGVTTNPSILAKAGRDPYEVLKEIRDFIGPDGELHVQVLSTRAEEGPGHSGGPQGNQAAGRTGMQCDRYGYLHPDAGIFGGGSRSKICGTLCKSY